MADKLQITYHPAKKEIKFKKYTPSTGAEIPIKLLVEKYANGEKGKFILQDHGNSFFCDIAKTFDSQEVVDIELITTKEDYEDFLQMLEEYNKTKKVEQATINATLLSELPDMKETFAIVEKHGKESASLLKEKIPEFKKLNSNNQTVQRTVADIENTISIEIKSIEKQVEELSNNDVALCFAGVYSAGKSTLVNAILGYAILPEAIKSETAKMFKIRTPKEDENIRIAFTLDGFDSQIIWNKDTAVLEWVTGPSENTTKAEIQEVINTNKAKKQHEQICELLRKLNILSNVDSEINILFPVPLDDDKVQFTIYDTPGSDSNVDKHQLILQEALNDQKKSILILVAAPDKIEGEGNNALLTYIKDAEKKEDNKTCIDIGRSLFVINKIETILESSDRESLKTCELKNKDDEDFSIQLCDKKLLFVSSKYAYKAKAIKAKLITEDAYFKANKEIFFNNETGLYYRLNHCGTSEFATKNLIERANDEFEKANKKNDDIQKYIVSSGLFSIEQEIKNYGVKYASAVRAYAIIKSVEKSLNVVSHQVNMLKNSSKEELDNKKIEIESEKEKLLSQTKEICEKHMIRNNQIPEDILNKLEITPSYFKCIVEDNAHSVVDKILKKSIFGTKIEKQQEQKIQTEIQGLTNTYTANFAQKRLLVLQELSDTVTTEIKNVVYGNNNLSDKTKEILSNFTQPNIPEFNASKTVKDLFDKLVIEKHHRWFGGLIEWDSRKIDLTEFKNDLKGQLSTIQTSIRNSCVNDFSNTVKTICESINTSFYSNIQTYSDRIISLLDEKNTMEQLCLLLESLLNELNDKQRELDRKIWESKDANR